MKNNHWIWMVIGCGLPLLFIFLAPSFGIGGNSSLFIFILFMFTIHLFIPHGSHGHGRHNQNDQDNKHNNSKENTVKKNKKHQHY